MPVLPAPNKWKKNFKLIPLLQVKNMEAIKFLIETIFDLFLMVILLRFWLQTAKADFYNPLSQFVVKVTSFAVNPLRKIIPGFAGLDIASLLLAVLIAVAKISILMLIFNGIWNAPSVIKYSFVTLLNNVFFLLYGVLIIRALLSWLSQGYNPMEAVFHQLTEPMLRPIRKVIPPLGGFDLSFIVLFIALQFLQKLIMSFLIF
tara:strand:+ start:13520 stop:14128 length:609 start_codon:yes stop_codon:yes gene_type:complete